MQKPSTEASQHFDRRQRFVLDGLLKMKAAASDIQTAIRLFQEVDEDNSGEWIGVDVVVIVIVVAATMVVVVVVVVVVGYSRLCCY